MKNKRIFISGGAGVIGTALVNTLLKQGADLFVGDLKPCPEEWHGKLKYRQGDLNGITKQELQGFNPEFFFHLAATFERSEETFPFFEENYHHNIRLTHHLLEILKASSDLKKVVFASSYLIYDPSLYQSEKVVDTVTALKEDSRIYPRNLCGAAKLFDELEFHFLSNFLNPKTSFLSARIFRVYGKGSRDIISRWVRAALQGEQLTVYRPEGKFDYIYAEDVAEGLIHLATTSHNGIVNLGSGEAHSIQEVVDLLKKQFPDLKIINESSSIPFEHSKADISRLEEWTRWRPPHRLEDALPKLIEFEKKQRSLEEKHVKHHAVLATSISKKIPLLNSLKQAISRSNDFNKLYGADSQDNCIGKYGVDEFWHCPSLSELKFEQLLDYCQSHHISAIIPTRDGELPYFSSHKDKLQQAGIAVLVSNSESIDTCIDKLKFAQSLKKVGLPAIDTSETLSDLKGDKFVVKERRGAGYGQMGLKLSKTEALEYGQKLKEPIFQTFVEGEEWSLDVYRSNRGKVMGVVARRRELIANGESQITTTAFNPELERLAVDISDHLDLYGHAVIQILVDQNSKPHIIECNPRFGGASTASLAVGLDTFSWFLAEASGLDISDRPFARLPTNLRQIRTPHDLLLPWSS